MKKVFICFLFCFAMGMFFPSCYFDKEDSLYPFIKCDTTHATYSQTIVPIINANCIVCHAAGNNVSTVILDSWVSLQVYARNGKLMAAINHTGSFPMPKGGSMLDVCSIEKIQRWVAGGAHDN